jgi:hypothetical protein
MRLSYTNVTATLALFLALGGTSYAAATLSGGDVRNGTVTGKDLRSQSVTGRDIDNGSLTGSDLENGSVGSSDLASLAAADFKAGQLPAGPRGTTTVVSRRPAPVLLRPGEAQDLIASCLPGEVAVGGGATRDGALDALVNVEYSHPLEADGSPPEDEDRPARWLVGARNHPFSTIDSTFTAFVLCANA